jgi:prophage regulatory protein
MITVVSPNADSIRILRLPQVCEVTGLCRSMIYQMEADLRFPQRVKIGTRAVGWVEKEVNAWLMRRIATSRRQSHCLETNQQLDRESKPRAQQQRIRSRAGLHILVPGRNGEPLT